MKRASMGARLESYEHVLMCLICRSLFDDYDHQPKFLPCHHTFCKDCLREYVKHVGDEIECPSCRKIANIPAAGISALQTNFYVKYIQSLVMGGGDLGITTMQCSHHPDSQLKYYCYDCHASQCHTCKCAVATHKRVPLTTVTEEYHQKLDTSFTNANALIERKKVELEGMLKAFSEEKDHALLKIDATMEQHVHTLSRRATLLKNKVIDIYNEHEQRLDADLEEISTAMTCIVSLKEFHEDMISRGEFAEIDKGINEMEEVNRNISEHVKPMENHIVFEEKHGADKLRACAKDLGRVCSKRPAVVRSEPEGTDDTESIRASRPLSARTAITNGAGQTYEISDGSGGSQKASVPTCKTNDAVHPKTLELPAPVTVHGRKNVAKCDHSVVSSKARPRSRERDLHLDLVPSSGLNNKTGVDASKLKVDKSYLHLVYTSYDEEELSKALKINTQQGLHSEQYIDNSDSWMTTSSNDENNSVESPFSDDVATQP